jgi:hypothetical protein
MPIQGQLTRPTTFRKQISQEQSARVDHSLIDFLAASLTFSLSCFSNAHQLVTQKCGVSTTHIDCIHVNISHDPMFPLRVLAVDRQSQILGHYPVIVDHLDTRRLEIVTEIAQGVIGVEFGTVQ